MSGLPSGISVFRYIPKHLVDGYISGEYRLWGGVLRRAFGEGRGQIVGFLTEGWQLARQIEQGLPISAEALQSAVGNAKMAAQLATGIGVLNLGVQVAGFALVLKRLDRISGQLDGIQRDLIAVAENIAWLEKMMLGDLRARAGNALSTAERAMRQRDRILLNQARTIADGVRRRIVDLLGEMLATGRAIPQRRLFAELLTFATLLAHAEARCDDAIEGAGQAANDLQASATQLRHLTDSFSERFTNFDQNPIELLRIGDAGRQQAKSLVSDVDTIVTRLEAYVPQLEFRHTYGLDTDPWQTSVADEGGGIISCITLDDPKAGDLLTFAKGQPTISPGKPPGS